MHGAIWTFAIVTMAAVSTSFAAGAASSQSAEDLPGRFAASASAPASAPAAVGPKTLLLDGPALAANRQLAMAKDASLADAMALLRRRADKEMAGKIWAVTDKPEAGPSGDKHDYVSLASYAWPDPKSPTSLPYVTRDGELNPEVLQYDRYRLEPMCQAVYVLSLAYYYTGEERYAARAGQQLRAWFLDDATRMNPNLTYGQIFKGWDRALGVGIIETAALTQVVDAVALLEGSPAWPAADQQRLKEWFAQYTIWLLTSPGGIEEANRPQNHGTHYDLQTADFALFAGKTELAKTILLNARARRIAAQVEPDGRQPLEAARTKGLGYSYLNLSGMFGLARLGEHVGADLWNFRTKDGRSMRQALEWLIPYATGQKTWELKQITKMNHNQLATCLRQAARAYNQPGYEDAIAHVVDLKKDDLLWMNLLYPPKQGK